MARAEADTWDLATSVGATATMVATARALATAEPGAIIDDPYADPLVRAVGVEFFIRLLDGELSPPDGATGAERQIVTGAERQIVTGAERLLVDVMAVRTRFFDDFFLDAGGAGVGQAVILASGLDSRPYRLPWRSDTVVYEIDQPAVIAFKTSAMDAIGATPIAERRVVAVDLREDWPAALRAAGFDRGQPTAWSAEGLLVYLPPDAQDRLFDDITALSAPGSRLATEYHADGGAAVAERVRTFGRQWRDHGFDVDLADLFYGGDRSSVVDYLTERGWRVATENRPAVFARFGRSFPTGDTAELLRGSLAVTATRT